MKQWDVSGMVGAEEMASMGDEIEQTAQNREQGKESGAGVVLVDCRKKT